MLEISRSGYYSNRKPELKIDHENEIISLFQKHKGRRGKRPIQKLLLRKGIKISLYKIVKVLRKHNLVAKGGRKRQRKVEKEETVAIAQNLIEDKFSVTLPDKLLCADICQVRCASGWVYISGIIDVALRELVGWAVATHMRKEIVIESIEMAHGRYHYSDFKTIFHSDNGSQYTAKKTQELLAQKQILTSRSRPGKPMDNQPIESFWKTLKRELADEIRHLKFSQAKMEIINYIGEYNSERLHSSLNYQTPFEARALLSA